MQPRIWSLTFVFVLIISASNLCAQDEREDNDPPNIDVDWVTFESTLYNRGDKTFNMSVGVIFPTFFYFADPIPEGSQSSNMSMGGAGALSFNYFLTSNLFIGGELAAIFTPTLGGNMFFMIPFGARIGYQFILNRFEFPLSLMLGGARQSLLEQRYLGFIIQPSAGAFWRFSQDWSFGLNATWSLVPQNGLDEEGIKRTVLGNFLALTFTARFHF